MSRMVLAVALAFACATTAHAQERYLVGFAMDWWYDNDPPPTEFGWDEITIIDGTVPSYKWQGSYNAVKNVAHWKGNRISGVPFLLLINKLTNGENDVIVWWWEDQTLTYPKEINFIEEGVSVNGIDLQGWRITRIDIHFAGWFQHSPTVPIAARIHYHLFGERIK